MSSKKLKNAPLQEVVFEVTWELPVDQNGIHYDPGFEKAFGLFAQKMQAQFPVQKPMLPPNAKAEAYTLIHQFWQGELIWPVIRIGSGILTVNDTEGNYVWGETYRPVIEVAVNALIESYAVLPAFSGLRLQYVDAVDVDPSETNSLEYVAKNFLIDIKNTFPLPGRHKGINMSQSFDLGDESTLNIQIQTAKNTVNNNNALIWITQVERDGLFAANEILPWLDEAHNKCSEVFVSMLSPEFYDAFDQ